MKIADYIHRLFSWLYFRLWAKNTLGYGIHSPYLYYIVRFLFYDDNSYYCFSEIEKERKRLLRATKTIQVTDYGCGKSGERKLKDIATMSLASSKEAQLLFRIVNYLKPNTAIELGTSLGITTSYLAAAMQEGKINTFEGSETVAAEAKRVFDNLKLKNINQVIGNIDITLPQYLQTVNQIDFAFLDANHTFEATINYFNMLLPYCHSKTVLVLDDIHYSLQMNKAWKQICQNQNITAAIDMWDLGLLFFEPQLEKKNYRVRI